MWCCSIFLDHSRVQRGGLGRIIDRALAFWRVNTWAKTPITALFATKTNGHCCSTSQTTAQCDRNGALRGDERRSKKVHKWPVIRPELRNLAKFPL